MSRIYKRQEMEVKDKIVKGAEELFFSYGIKAITMDDIAKHLSVSKKTLYLHFADKNELVEYLMKLKFKTDENEFKRIQEGSENVVAQVFTMMRYMGEMLSRVNPKLFYDLKKYHPNAWKLFQAFKKDCIECSVESCLEKGKQQGLVRADINSAMLARLRVEEVEMAMDPEIFPPEEYKIIDVQLSLLDHFLHGICTIKGHKLINKYKQIIEEE